VTAGKSPLDDIDLRALLAAPPRKAPGRTAGSRAARERRPISSTDGRVRRGLGRSVQFNVKCTPELDAAVKEACFAYDLTKPEFFERAALAYIEALKAE
jgi:hypothetical protein